MHPLEIKKQKLLDRYAHKKETLKEDKEFLSFISDITAVMLQKSNNTNKDCSIFYANILVQLERIIDTEIIEPTDHKVEFNGIKLYLNPRLLLKYSLEDIKSLLIHECSHIVLEHTKRSSKYWNIVKPELIALSLDCCVNQIVNRTAKDAITLNEYCEILDADITDIKQKESFEYYLLYAISHDKSNNYKNKETINKLKKTHSKMKSSSQSDIDTSENIVKEIIDAAIQKVKQVGDELPYYVEEEIKKRNTKPILSWQDILKRYKGTIPVPYKKTLMRKNRRTPNRLDTRGKLNDHRIDIVAAIDTSGSMSNEEISYALNEILAILKDVKFTLTVVECDTKINREYQIKKAEDIQNKVNGRGGTLFTPVFEYMKEKRKRNSLLIYFTDGYGEYEIPKPYHYKTLWVITVGEHLSVANPYGEVKSLNLERKD